ncbi:MAG: phenylalanine 4-monooxygenase [Micropepsaceae bacterium]
MGDTAQLFAKFRAQNPDIRPDYTIDQNWKHYTPAEHATWKILYSRLDQILPRFACTEFVDGMHRLDIGREEIPEFTTLSRRLSALTGWSVVAVPGLVPDDIFFEHLANRRFPAGNFIRRADQLDYIEQPDVFHDVFGHVPMLAHPVFADYMEAYGKGGLRALNRFDALPNLARLYWYTVEFGLIRTPDGMKVYGAGIASSTAETAYSVDDPSPNRIAFNLERVMRTKYRIDDFQESYFVIDSFDQLFAETYRDFAEVYEKLKTGPSYEPGHVDPVDKVHHRGTRSYKPHSHERSA